MNEKYLELSSKKIKWHSKQSINCNVGFLGKQGIVCEYRLLDFPIKLRH